jgi:hypothetical protein
MKIKSILLLATILPILASCTKSDSQMSHKYVFLQPYCERVTIGGFVGTAEKCFKVGDVIVGSEIIDGQVITRIAEHNSFNDGLPTSNSYQEFMNIPLSYLRPLKGWFR